MENILRGQQPKLKPGMRRMLAKIAALDEVGAARYEIGYRGGYYKIKTEAVLSALNIPERYLDSVPGYIGAGCNYLGGGLRGAITHTTGFASHGVPKTYAQKLERFAEALAVRYEQLENGLNDETDNDGEPNWEAIGTNASRRAGIVSAY